MKKTFLIFLFSINFLFVKASQVDLFFYDIQLIESSLSELTQLENQLINCEFDVAELRNFSSLRLVSFNPDGEAKSFGDSFFKGFTLGCLGLLDAYLSDDRKKYKRGPLWTGCCLNTVGLATLYYLLDINYFHLIPPPG